MTSEQQKRLRGKLKRTLRDRLAEKPYTRPWSGSNQKNFTIEITEGAEISVASVVRLPLHAFEKLNCSPKPVGA
jgi:hypothetical protein